MIATMDKNVRNGFESENQRVFPTIVNLCVLRGSCPCKCVHCPIGLTPISERKIRFGDEVIPLELYEKVLEEMAKFKHSVLRIHSVGEPLLWKNLESALVFSKRKNVKTWLFTCLVTRNIALLGRIAEYCSVIEISINSYDRENYLETKGIDAFYLVVNNIRYIHDTIKKGKLNTRLIVSRVESEDKRYDKDFVAYWGNSELVNDAFIRTYHNYNDVIDNKFHRDTNEIIPCLVHWSRFNIDCDGKAILCFNELFKGPKPDERLIVGDVTKNNISEIWHGRKISLIRKAQLGKNYAIIDFTENLPCKSCFSCQTISGLKITSKKHIKASKEKSND